MKMKDFKVVIDSKIKFADTTSGFKRRININYDR